MSSVAPDAHQPVRCDQGGRGDARHGVWMLVRVATHHHSWKQRLGPNEYPEKMILKFAVLAKRGEKISIHGDGTATRSYMHVDNASSAFDIILHRGTTAQIYTIGLR